MSNYILTLEKSQGQLNKITGEVRYLETLSGKDAVELESRLRADLQNFTKILDNLDMSMNDSSV